ncbi:MAG: ABC transporter substrate-binding protein [Candidatus Thermoplasmatota archaeon]|nr:ABC transporter substrate-binding protein [Candidatus Thermoplasmatota archaeon]
MTKNTKAILAVVVVVILVAAGVSVFEFYHPASKPVFTDTSQTAAPGELDPATGFFTTDEPLYTALYQELTSFHGTGVGVEPVLAKSVSNVSERTYTFNLRHHVTFSNGKPMTAPDVWFSLYRTIIMGQGVDTSNYANILFNATDYGKTGVSLPWGTINAFENDTSSHYNVKGANFTATTTNTANALDYVLSNFNTNASNMKLMNYSNQAVVVNNNYSVTVKGMFVYSFMLSDLAGWWGAVVYPAQIDANGGVVYNQQNTYINDNGAIGTGTYVVSSASAGLDTVVLKKNPNYWYGNSTAVPSVAQPGHIPEIVIKYGLSHADRVLEFDKNTSQISTVAPGAFKDIITNFYNSAEANISLVHSFKIDGVFYFSMNMQRSFTSNVHFRRALIEANNYSEQSSVYANNYNNQSESYNELGPISPSYGSAFYNPSNLPLQSHNLKYALQNISIAGNQTHFYVTVGGKKYGDISGTDLTTAVTFNLTGIAPLNSIETAQFTYAISSFAKIGLTFASKTVTESTFAGLTKASSFPRFMDLGWVPDYPDPIGQQLMPVYDIAEGGALGGNDAFANNSTLQSLFSKLDFQSTAVQQNAMNQIYNITYNLSAYIWLPMPNSVFFVQPYVHNFIYNPYVGYFYNLLTISYHGTSGSAAVSAAISGNNPSNSGPEFVSAMQVDSSLFSRLF